MTAQFNIKNGPPRFSIMLALFNNNAEDGLRYVEFVISKNDETPTTIKVLISSLEREDGSGDSWNFGGTTDDLFGKKRLKIFGYFSSKNRTGVLYAGKQCVSCKAKGLMGSFCYKCGNPLN